MRVVPIDDHMHSRWQEGKTQDGRQITSLHTEWHVTNITPHSIRVLDARLIRPRLKRGVDVKHVAVRGLETGEIGQFPIPLGPHDRAPRELDPLPTGLALASRSADEDRRRGRGPVRERAPMPDGPQASAEGEAEAEGRAFDLTPPISLASC
jgi:hypothetical protein